MTPCGSFADKPRFREDWQPVWDKYRRCREFNALPRPGGMNQQNGFEMAVFQAMADGERWAELERQTKTVQSGGPFAGLLAMLSMTGRRNG